MRVVREAPIGARPGRSGLRSPGPVPAQQHSQWLLWIIQAVLGSWGPALRLCAVLLVGALVALLLACAVRIVPHDVVEIFAGMWAGGGS